MEKVSPIKISTNIMEWMAPRIESLIKAIKRPEEENLQGAKQSILELVFLMREMEKFSAKIEKIENVFYERISEAAASLEDTDIEAQA